MNPNDENNGVLLNSHNNIDLCVSSVKEIEAPLGGKSVVYEINVKSDLKFFKSKDSSSDGEVKYSILKTFREIEDLVNKLKKFTHSKFLVLHKAQASVEENRSACDQVFRQISKNSSILQCPILLQFLGVDPTTNELTISIAPVKVEENIEAKENFPSGSDEKEDFDLFEELVKKEKEKRASSIKNSIELEKDENVPTELFACENKQSEKLPSVKSVSEVSDKTSNENLPVFKTGLFSESQRRDVSMFEEQDYGEVLTKEEEHLFYVPRKTVVEKQTTASTESKDEDVFRVDDELGDLLVHSNAPHKETTSQEMKEMMDSKHTATSQTQQSSFSSPTTPANPRNLKKPAPPPKPKSLAKPVPPPKPKPTTNVNSPVKQTVIDCDELDIFKYIEQEEQASTQEASLFD